jgi:NTE family protein
MEHRRRYRSNAAECLSAASTCHPDHHSLLLGIDDRWIALARQEETKRHFLVKCRWRLLPMKRVLMPSCRIGTARCWARFGLSALISSRNFGRRWNISRGGGIPRIWRHGSAAGRLLADFTNQSANMMALFGGVAGYYTPNHALAWGGAKAALGVERAALYDTKDLEKTMTALTDPACFNSESPRLTVGTVNVKTGKMHYWDSERMPLALNHVLASAALPPSFPAVRIDGDPYWDGGIYSNTPIEAVFDDNPRRDSVIFADQMWHTSGPEPQSLEDVLSRQKDIQFASRDDSHIARQQDLHRLRHIVRELVKLVPEDQRISPEVKQFAAYGCRTFMHVVRLNAPHIEGEGNSRDIDFTSASIRARWKAGHDDTARALERRPWEDEFDPMAGVAVHNCEPAMLGRV